jgi:PDDEXK-like domain of unknown function (DUF3799)
VFDVIRWDGQPITEPGLYSSIPLSEYHKQSTTGVSISSGGLRTIFSESPAHYYDGSYLNPDREEQTPSEAMILGQAAHHLLLGEEKFGHSFVIRPEELNGKPWHGNRGDCKEWLEARAEERVTVLKGEHVTKIRGMSKSLAAHPLVQAGILNGIIEHSACWIDEETGIWLKSRPDCWPVDSADLVDLKTAADITDDGIARAIASGGYQMQGALVGMACRAVLGIEMESFSLVFVESARPHCVRVKTLKPADLELGERQIRASLRLFARCVERNEWPGPGGIQSDADFAELTPWARTNIEFKLSQMESEPSI